MKEKVPFKPRKSGCNAGIKRCRFKDSARAPSMDRQTTSNLWITHLCTTASLLLSSFFFFFFFEILQNATMSTSSTTPQAISLSFSFSSSSSSLFLSSSHLKLPSLFPFFKLHKPHKPLSISCQVATLPILSFNGEKIGETYLDLKSAPSDTARAVVHRAIITAQQNKRRGTASTLTRSEVRGGGRKPYPQKKTGRARRGSMRSPLRPGGGVIFGPKPKDWSIKINKKEKRLAISTALSSATESMICVEEFGEKFERPKTKVFIEAMKRWGLDPKEKNMFLVTELSDNVGLSSRNIGTLRMLTPRTLNLFDILNSDKLILTPEIVDYLNARYGEDYEGEDDNEEEEEDEVEEEEVKGGGGFQG